MTTHEWAAIPRSTGYEVSRTGVVRSWRRPGTGSAPRIKPHILKQRLTRDGYPLVCIVVDGQEKTRPVHRLVLEAFHGPCPPGQQACHNNGISHDNRVENLRWDTCKANQDDKRLHGTLTRVPGERHGLSKFSESQIRQVIALLARGVPGVAIEKETGVDRKQVSAIKHGKRWAHLQRPWEARL